MREKHLRFIFSLILISLFRGHLSAGLSDSGMNLTGIDFSAVSWADYDRDGDYDLAICGKKADGTPLTAIYENQNGSLVKNTSLSADLIDVEEGSIAWGDYDQDGYLDLALSGRISTDDQTGLSRIYRFTGGSFVLVKELQPVYRSSLAWGDYDNDGDMDLFLMGLSGANYAKLYENQNGSFVDSGLSFKKLSNGHVTWADYNNDGWLDLAMVGYNFDNSEIDSIIYDNSGGIFTESASTITAVQNGCIAWGDYDNDGDMDLALTGSETFAGKPITEIYNNSGSPDYELNLTTFNLTDVYNSYCAWGDYDNDGDLDLALLGTDGGYPVPPVNRYLEIWKGTDFSTKEELGAPLEFGTLCWADYDRDRDLDLAVCGSSESVVLTRVYENDEADNGNANNIPYFPESVSGLFSYEFKNQKLTLSWPDGVDDDGGVKTPPSGLTYHLWVGQTRNIGESDIISAIYGTPLMGGFISKYKKDGKNSRTINVEAGTFYWMVQVIDTGLGYSWYDVGNTSHSLLQVAIDTSAPLGYPGTPIDEGKYTYRQDIKFEWDAGSAYDPDSGIQGYFLEVGTSKGANDVYRGDVGNVSTYEIKGTHGITYYARVKARNGRTDLDYDVDKSTIIYTYEGPYGGWSASSDGITILKMLEIDRNVFKPLQGDAQPNIIYQLKEPTYVRLKIYNLMGEEVRELVKGYVTRLDNNKEWDGKNNDGEIVASGVYLVNIRTGYGESTEKIVVVK